MSGRTARTGSCGHWLNGRLGSVPLSALIEAVLADHEFDDHAVADVSGLVGGYLVNEVLSARATLEPVLQAFRIDAADAGDKVLFRGRNRPGDLAVAPAALVEPPGRAEPDAEPRAGDGACLRNRASRHRPRQGLSNGGRILAAPGGAEPAERHARPYRRARFRRSRAADGPIASRHLDRARAGGARAAAERARRRGRRPPVADRGNAAGDAARRADRGRAEPKIPAPPSRRGERAAAFEEAAPEPAGDGARLGSARGAHHRFRAARRERAARAADGGVRRALAGDDGGL